MNDWLDSVKVGDEVAVYSKHSAYRFENVIRVTDTRIVTPTGRFVRRTGLKEGSLSKYSTPISITDPTRARKNLVEQEQQKELQELRSRVATACYRCAKKDLLIQVLAVLAQENSQHVELSK